MNSLLGNLTKTDHKVVNYRLIVVLTDYKARDDVESQTDVKSIAGPIGLFFVLFYIHQTTDTAWGLIHSFHS